MGATEDRINHLTQTREEAKRWLVARLRTTPEPLDPFHTDGTQTEVLRDELDREGELNFKISLRASEEGFKSMTLEDIAEQLLCEVAEVLKEIRRDRRLLGEVDGKAA